MAQVDTMLQRILSVDWTYDPSRRRSHEALFKEFLRRQVLWLDALDQMEDYPCYDLATLVNDKVRASMDATNAVRHHLSGCALNSTMILSGVLENTLHWAALEDTGLIPANKLPPPYEPIVILYERGGTFTIEHMFGRFVIAYDNRGPSLPRSPWRRWHQDEPFVELASTALDALDR